MDLKREVTQTTPESNAPKPLELLRDTEALLRCKTVETLVTVLPPPVAISLAELSDVAEDSLNQLAEIELDEISDFELQPARLLVALNFVGFGALAIVFLILYLYTLHPELSAVEQIRELLVSIHLVCQLGCYRNVDAGSRSDALPKSRSRVMWIKFKLKSYIQLLLWALAFAVLQAIAPS